MKRIFIAVFALALTFTTVSCSNDSDPAATTVTVDSAAPIGAFTVSKSGTLTAQNGTPTTGKIETGTDSQGNSFVHLGTDFKTELGTGTATVYLSKTATFTSSPGTGNPDLKLVGIVTKNGEAYYKLSGAAPADLPYVIIWCGTAGIPFGNGLLK
ncbi:DM13 domain-containing protein [Flavobacterium faecale]|nr:DM13 domain-containing protein [Flavobacterium faecale]